MAPAVSVVICTYTSERWALLERSIESVLAQEHPALEVLVVVDHDEDLLRRIGRRWALTALASTGAPGLSGARNTGVAAASGDVVAFLDDDATAEPGWLAALVAPYADPHVIGVGGTILPAWAEGRPATFPAEFDWVVGCTHLGTPAAGGPVRNLTGANMSFRSSALRRVGGFRDGLGRVGRRPLGCEETELCVRLRRRHPSSELVHQPAARVHHHVPAERATFRYFRRRCWSEGRSKHAVARHVGRADALRAERRYVATTLPAGVGADIGSFLRHGDVAALGQAAWIAAGVLCTTAGYAAAAVESAGHGRTVPGPAPAVAS